MPTDVKYETIHKILTKPEIEGGHFHQGYVNDWTEARWRRFESRALHEVDYTALLCAMSGEAEVALAHHFLRVGGVRPDSDNRYRVVRASDLDAERRTVGHNLTRRVPDFFVASSPRDASVPSRWRPVVAVEAKFHAFVNASFGYCPAAQESGQGHAGYSNQIVCYIGNCWLADDSSVPESYVWLDGVDALDKTLPISAVNKKDVERYPGLADFKPVQDESWSRWRSAHHVEIVEIGGVLDLNGLSELAVYLRNCSPFLPYRRARAGG